MGEAQAPILSRHTQRSPFSFACAPESAYSAGVTFSTAAKTIRMIANYPQAHATAQPLAHFGVSESCPFVTTVTASCSVFVRLITAPQTS